METRVAAYGVLVRGDRMLLAHWNVRGRSGWTLPGGGLDPGEDPVDAVVREVLEETGYDVTVSHLLGVDSLVIDPDERITDPGGALHAVRIVYRAEIIGGSLRPEQDGSTDRAEWFGQSEIDALDRVELVDAGRRFAGLLPMPTEPGSTAPAAQAAGSAAASPSGTR